MMTIARFSQPRSRKTWRTERGAEARNPGSRRRATLRIGREGGEGVVPLSSVECFSGINIHQHLAAASVPHSH
jgi:hypothetical protein